jgi:hypothetical protein
LINTDGVADEGLQTPGLGALKGGASKVVVIFFWDGASDLVVDTDMTNIGTPSSTNDIGDKTGVSVSESASGPSTETPVLSPMSLVEDGVPILVMSVSTTRSLAPSQKKITTGHVGVHHEIAGAVPEEDHHILATVRETRGAAAYICGDHVGCAGIGAMDLVVGGKAEGRERTGTVEGHDDHATRCNRRPRRKLSYEIRATDARCRTGAGGAGQQSVILVVRKVVVVETDRTRRGVEDLYELVGGWGHHGLTKQQVVVDAKRRRAQKTDGEQGQKMKFEG